MLRKIQFPPGVDRSSTAYHAEGRWFDMDNMRFYAGEPEKLGGWATLHDTAFLGVCRGITVWREFDETKENRRVAFGTHKKLYIYYAGDIIDITPLRDSGTLGTDPFTTTSGSTTVVVSDMSHGALQGDYVTFSGADPVGGITIDGEYEIDDLIDDDSYEITHSAAASSSATGGGTTVDYEYDINTGFEDTAFTFGYGIGGYGEGTYGTPSTTSNVTVSARTWTLAAWGENLLASHRRGNIYEWDPNTGGRAQLVANAPTDNMAMFVTAEKHVVAVGASSSFMTVAWSDQADNTTWAAAADNQAGSQELGGGRQLLRGMSLGRGVNLIWSESDCFSMTFLPDSDLVFSFEKQGDGAGAIGPNSVAERSGVAFWMSQNDFYMYDGFPRPLPSDAVRDYVFGDLNVFQGSKVYAGTNHQFGEVWWFYCSLNATEIDRCVVYNFREGFWWIGTVARTAWIDRSIYVNPIATSADGFLYIHEEGKNDDGATMEGFIKSAPFDVGDGDAKVDVFGIVPDYARAVGDIDVELDTKDKPNDTAVTNGPYTTTSSSTRVDTRANGRQVAIKFITNSLDGDLRLGAVRFDIQPAGRRR